jgi:hypothetical protein
MSDASPPPEPPPPPALSEPPLLLATCALCRTPSRPGARFCARCGAALSALPDREEQRRVRAAARLVREQWGHFKGVLWFFLLVMALQIAAKVVHAASDADAPLVDAVLSAAMAAAAVGFALRERESVGPALARAGLRGANLPFVLAVTAGVFAAVALYFRLLTALGAPNLRYLDDFRESGWPLWSAFLLTSLMPGVFEEIAFRGFVQGRLTRLLGSREALLLSAALFAVAHLSPAVFPSHFLLGLALGAIRARTGSLLPGMAVHAGWNALVLLGEMGVLPL